MPADLNQISHTTYLYMLYEGTCLRAPVGSCEMNYGLVRDKLLSTTHKKFRGTPCRSTEEWMGPPVQRFYAAKELKYA